MHLTLGDLPLCETDEAGVRWSAQRGRVVGWGSPGSTIRTQSRARGHGVWAGDAWLGARHLAVGGLCFAGDEAALSEACDRLAVAVSLSGATLVVREGTRERWLTVRRDGEVLWSTVTPGGARGQAVAEWSVQLLATDPRKRGAALSATTGLPSTVGGLTWPVSWPLSWPAVVVSGSVSLTNPGNVAGPVRLRIVGPVRAPVVTHVSSGRRLVFASSLVLGVGEFATVDMEARQVLAQGVEPRNAWVVRREWSGFEPGVNVWAFSAGADSVGTLMVEAVPTWL